MRCGFIYPVVRGPWRNLALFLRSQSSAIHMYECGTCGGHASVVRVLLEKVVCVVQVVSAVYGLGGVVQFVWSV